MNRADVRARLETWSSNPPLPAEIMMEAAVTENRIGQSPVGHVTLTV